MLIDEKRKNWIKSVIEMIDDGSDHGFCFEDNIICPWCGEEWYPDFECEYCYNEGEHAETCICCEKSLTISTSVIISYSTSRIESEGTDT